MSLENRMPSQMRNPTPSPSTQIKIGIVGSKEVGKTILAHLLNSELKVVLSNKLQDDRWHSDLVYESARNCPLPLNEKTTIQSAYWLFGAQIASEAVVHARMNTLYIICDRTVIDAYPFAMHAIKNELEKSGRNAEESKERTRALLEPLKTLIKDYIIARPYHFLFYVPIRRDTQGRHKAPDDPVFQAAIDKELRAFLRELRDDPKLQIDLIELEAPEGKGRVEEIIRHIHRRHPSTHSSTI
jgi:hypothetical protein